MGRPAVKKAPRASRRARRAVPRETATALADLVPDPANRRRHSDRNLAMVRASLEQVGAARSIVLDEGNVILAGNGVTEAALAAGLTKVRIIDAAGDELVAVRRRGLTDDQKRALALFDNRTAELATWDTDQLRADVTAGLDFAPWFSETELRQLGVLGDALVAGKTDPDAVPPPRATSVRPGDLFALGAHRLLCGDCTTVKAVGTLLKRAKPRLCFTSPPYADQRTYTGTADLAPAHLAKFLAVAAKRVEVFAINLGLARRDGFLLPYWDAYIEAAGRAGLGLLSWNVWSREGLQMSIGQATAMFPIQHEWILVFGAHPCELVPTVPNKTAGHTGQSTDRQADGTMSAPKSVTIRAQRELGTVLTLPAVRDNADHPAQFPVALPSAYLAALPGDLYDPFCGSGTTIIAAEQRQRACYALEIAPIYCQAAIDRWEAFTGQKAEKLGGA